MARATSQFHDEEHDQPATGEWQDLRSELVALLDEVETQNARPSRTGPVYEALAERVRDLRHQVAEAEPDTRHREALRSVQRAIKRFNDRDDAPATPRETLDAAIRQIRARQNPAAAAASAAAAPRIDGMAHSAEGISTRLERLEGELRLNARTQTANVKEIADQIAQLSQVVELLAGAVGEVGQVKRLESQIASLASILAEQPQPDLLSLNARLDEVSASVLKFSEIAGIGERLDDVSATVTRLADLQSEVAERPVSDDSRAERIEAGIRNLYDRIDTIEQKLSLPQPELDRLSEQLGQIAAAMKAPQQPQGLLELIDALNSRVAEIESRSEDIGALHADLLSLRETVLGSLEPRFVALESSLDTRLLALGDRVIDKLPNFNPAPLEAQVRQLVARMDQTGEQLTGLAKLYAQPAAGLPADIAELADLVAEKTSAAISRGQPDAAARIDTSDIDEIERRVTRIMADKAADGPTPELAAVEGTIREVNDRLARIEAMLTPADAEPVTKAAAMPAPMKAPVESREVTPTPTDPAAAERRRPRAAQPATAPVTGKPSSDAFAAALFAPEPASVSEPAPPAASADVAPKVSAVAAPKAMVSEPADGLGPLIRSLADDELLALAPEDVPAATATARASAIADSMPVSPAEDAPLVATPFPDPVVPSEAAAATAPRRHPGLEPAPELPPKPFSALDSKAAATAADVAPEPIPAPLDDVRPPSRNTFIEAHRRAARMAASAKPAAGSSDDSLIGRAFARFQAQRDAAATQPVPPPPAPATAEKPKSTRFTLKRPQSEAKPASTAAVPQADAPAEAGAPKTRKSLFSFGQPKQPDASSRAERRLAGDKPSPTAWHPDDARAAADGVAPAVSLAAEATAPPADGLGGKQSFLLRHRRGILLGASVIAIACLAVNLINQRLAEQEAAEPATVGDAALSPTPLAEQDAVAMGGPRIVPMVDQMTTGSVSGMPAQAFAPSATTLPATDAFTAVEQVAALAPTTLPALASPAIVDIPPEAVGPQPLRAAAAAGDARAQFEVAAIYTEGRAVPEDLAEAAVWYERAASQGFAPAQYRLGTLYEHGNGVEKDLSLARLWYQRAAEAGNRLAMHNLAALYAGGQLGAQQFDAAAKWFEEAASRGMKDSQFNLGMLYARGLGVTQDLAQSYKWFGIAASRGDADAAKARDDMAASLDAATVKQINEEIAAWRSADIDLVANFAPIGTWESQFDPGRTIDATDIVRGVQLALSTLGFDVGTPDGLAGPKTADAIRAFERATGMSESGAINPRLLAVLGSQPV
jgi:localization factor PodJL